jgi:hypothetical protein
MQKRIYLITSIVIMGAFVLSACGGANATPTATPVSVEAIQTAAAQTVIAQLTQQAPTITPTPAFTNTPNVTATPTLAQPTLTKPAPTAANCANYLFISDVTIPDGTQMPAGQAFTKTWRVQNTGTCTWTTNFKLAFSFGEAMGGQAVPFASAVPTGQKVDISVDLKVPNKTGKLTGAWVLVDDKGQHFGAILTVVINVGAVSPTPTGSATVEPTQTKTPASTSTDTPVPSETPTETLVPTA